MTTGLVLIAAILVLGGVIATMGDRIGMRVGKSRLSLFKLRPRQTATLITILTGVLISASTFGILFAIDDQLRTGVFELEDIQQELASAREELQQTQAERNQIEQELNTALSQRRTAQQRLVAINESLQRAIAEQERTAQQAAALRGEIEQLQTDRQQQIARRDQEIAKLQQLQSDREIQIAQRERELAERNREVAERNRQIEERNRQIAERGEQLRQLEAQRSFLIGEVLNLEREFQGLRQGNVALLRNQPLASGVVRIVDPNAAPQAVDQLLREANRFVLQRIRPGNTQEQQIIQVTRNQVDQLVNQIRDGKDYVVRILSAGNFVVGEPCVLAGETCIPINIAVAPNEVLLQRGDVIASTTADPRAMNERQLVERINLLIATAQFRARQAGVLGDLIQIADGRSESVANFFEQLKRHNQPVTLQAIAAEPTYTAGPVRLELVALQNGQPIFSTFSLPQPSPPVRSD
ncbi:MAG TPA: DUF3084 domain-containing protein [Synechococcales cyanobacterium M55_K2018_004]|nr:DUF3084 domain-containing protein [Synechococcales cyanobacterium M55_K2018_004]